MSRLGPAKRLNALDDRKFQASIMKQSFEEHLTSTDRLRKVAGLSKYLFSPSDNVQNVDNIVLLVDTVIIKINGALRIDIIESIIRGKCNLKRATPGELPHCHCLLGK